MENLMENIMENLSGKNGKFHFGKYQIFVMEKTEKINFTKRKICDPDQRKNSIIRNTK